MRAIFKFHNPVICQIHLSYTGYCCPEHLLCKSSNEKRSEICIRKQFVTQMVRFGGEIENGDFDKGKNMNVGLFWYVIIAISFLKNFGERCQNSSFTANK